ncbi:Hint domain-containing protein [Acidisphaera sp. S103]|uniref:Hint domain-containing protein n=1 Tax=Acidisphaera sp. S103 TaxID=1747223 RepID=UPI00131E77CC|nr:Hint domain-containing protein [Acidisphaera sp. S103]
MFIGDVVGGGANSTFELAAGSGQTTLNGFGSSITNFGTLKFDPNADWVVDANNNIAGVTIVGFSPSDTINVAGVTDPTVTQSYSDGVTKVTLSGSSPVTLTFVGDLGTFHSTTIDGTTELTTLCFGPGTKIDTPNGEIRVENLAVGDTVRTLGNNGTRTITWIGVGKVLATRGHRSAATPVIVRANALGPKMPHADLRVTKAHSVYLDDVLIPVEFLVNHRTILWDDHAREVTLYHIELDAHDVVFTNGAPVESYRDDGNRWLFQNGNAGWDLPPLEPYAPVVTGGTGHRCGVAAPDGPSRSPRSAAADRRSGPASRRRREMDRCCQGIRAGKRFPPGYLPNHRSYRLTRRRPRGTGPDS